ncbi:MAG TPA: GAF domain-containing protein [Thermoanaerobaculia bacterium]|nr:GAF domain-containing protein [Thermoanaerobaculia bacterium]
MKRDFIEKAANDTREVVQSLLDENHKLSVRVTELFSELEEQSRRFSERYVEVEEQNTKLANLYVASYQLNGTLDRERVVGAIQEIIINLVGCEELAIWELDEDAKALMLAGSFGIDTSQWSRVPLGSGLIGTVAVTGERYIAGESVPDFVACIPLKLDEQVVGAIGIFSLLQQKTGLEPLDFELFDLLASHAASALYCTRLIAEQVQ